MTGVSDEELSGNLVLASLEAEERAKLAGRVRRTRYEPGEVLFGAGQTLREICFPLSGVISLIAGTDSGAQMEVAAVGSEGLVGLPLLLEGRDSGNLSAVCQMPSDSLVLTSEPLATWLDANAGRLPRILAAYVQLQLVERAQSAVCGRLHHLDRRCARRLLESHDRAAGESFPITHELLAQMLGVRRASVTLAARRLLRQGLIDQRRGSVTVLDREGLEAAACECYAVVRAAREQLTPVPDRWTGSRRPAA